MFEDLEYWKEKAIDYEWLYETQKEISIGYKLLCEEYLKEIQEIEKNLKAP